MNADFVEAEMAMQGNTRLVGDGHHRIEVDKSLGAQDLQECGVQSGGNTPAMEVFIQVDGEFSVPAIGIMGAYLVGIGKADDLVTQGTD